MNETILMLKNRIFESLSMGKNLQMTLGHLVLVEGYSNEDVIKAYKLFRNEMIKEAGNE